MGVLSGTVFGIVFVKTACTADIRFVELNNFSAKLFFHVNIFYIPNIVNIVPA